MNKKFFYNNNNMCIFFLAPNFSFLTKCRPSSWVAWLQSKYEIIQSHNTS